MQKYLILHHIVDKIIIRDFYSIQFLLQTQAQWVKLLVFIKKYTSPTAVVFISHRIELVIVNILNPIYMRANEV